MFEALKTRYKIKTIKKVLQPAETIVHTMNYKPNTLWRKQNYVDGNTFQNVGKDTVQLFYTYKPMTGPIYDSTDTYLKVGTLFSATTTSGGSPAGATCVTCEVHETYKIDCPDGMAVANTKDATCIFNAYESIANPATSSSYFPAKMMTYNTNRIAVDI